MLHGSVGRRGGAARRQQDGDSSSSSYDGSIGHGEQRCRVALGNAECTPNK